MNKLLSLFLLIITSFSTFAEENKKYDVYLLIGQSNMAGFGEFEPRDTVDAIDGVWILDPEGKPAPAVAPLNKFSTIRKDIKIQGFNPGTEFSRVMHERTGRPILLVVNARGGTSIKKWQPGADDAYFEEAVRRARQGMELGELKAILWHQGESDIIRNTPGYTDLFITMISSLRKELGLGDIPVVLGQVGRWNWADRGKIDDFNESVLPATVEAVPNSAQVSSEGLKRRFEEDELDPHFGREAQLELGRRYADVLTALMAKTASNPSGQEIGN